jgi:hypothetical protein
MIPFSIFIGYYLGDLGSIPVRGLILKDFLLEESGLNVKLYAP